MIYYYRGNICIHYGIKYTKSTSFCCHFRPRCILFQLNQSGHSGYDSEYVDIEGDDENIDTQGEMEQVLGCSWTVCHNVLCESLVSHYWLRMIINKQSIVDFKISVGIKCPITNIDSNTKLKTLWLMQNRFHWISINCWWITVCYAL